MKLTSNYDIKYVKEIIYDTNLIIAYCFFVKETHNNRIIPFRHRLTDTIQQITNELISDRKGIITLQIAIDEIYNKGISRIVSDTLSTRYPKVSGNNIIARILETKISRKLGEIAKKSGLL
jgi:hypothetical protein